MRQNHLDPWVSNCYIYCVNKQALKTIELKMVNSS